ncbi:hypothetical protein D3C80_827440 [compost metagenome]
MIHRGGERLDVLLGDRLTLGRGHTVDDVGGQVAKHHETEIHRRLVFLQGGDQVVHQGVKLLVIVL